MWCYETDGRTKTAVRIVLHSTLSDSSQLECF